jgi:hypothetical protein
MTLLNEIFFGFNYVFGDFFSLLFGVAFLSMLIGLFLYFMVFR